MKIESFIEKIKEKNLGKLVQFTQYLIQHKSLSGYEREIVNYLIQMASEYGYDEAYFDEMGNFIGKMVMGSGEGPTIVFTGHLDTVNANPADWSSNKRPFSGSLIDNKIYGRGASDMKGAVAAMFSAIADIKEIKSELNGTIYFVGTVIEELFEGVAFLEALKSIQPDYIIVGEASECKINVGQRGRAEIIITSYGQNQHASTGRKVINAIEQIAYIIDVFHRWYRSDVDNVLGKRNIVPTDIKIPVGGGGGIDGRGGNSTVPNKVELTYDIRILVGDTNESIIKLIKDNLTLVVKNARKKYPNFMEPTIRFANDESVTYTNKKIFQDKFAPAWKTEHGSDIILKSCAGLKKFDQYFSDIEYGSYSFCTDGSAIVKYRELFPNKKVEIIGFGPGHEKNAHIIDEYISVDDLKKSFYGYLGIIVGLLEK